MKQYRITSEHFATPGDTGESDAHLHDLAELKRLAGVGSLGLLENYSAGASAADIDNHISNNKDQDMSSPLGGKDSMPNSEKYNIEKSKHIKVGSPEWFKLWFAKPWLTGEKPVGDAPSDKVQRDKDNQ